MMVSNNYSMKDNQGNKKDEYATTLRDLKVQLEARKVDKQPTAATGFYLVQSPQAFKELEPNFICNTTIQ